MSFESNVRGIEKAVNDRNLKNLGVTGHAALGPDGVVITMSGKNDLQRRKVVTWHQIAVARHPIGKEIVTSMVVAMAVTAQGGDSPPLVKCEGSGAVTPR